MDYLHGHNLYAFCENWTAKNPRIPQYVVEFENGYEISGDVRIANIGMGSAGRSIYFRSEPGGEVLLTNNGCIYLHNSFVIFHGIKIRCKGRRTNCVFNNQYSWLQFNSSECIIEEFGGNGDWGATFLHNDNHALYTSWNSTLRVHFNNPSTPGWASMIYLTNQDSFASRVFVKNSNTIVTGSFNNQSGSGLSLYSGNIQCWNGHSVNNSWGLDQIDITMNSTSHSCICCENLEYQSHNMRRINCNITGSGSFTYVYGRGGRFSGGSSYTHQIKTPVRSNLILYNRNSFLNIECNFKNLGAGLSVGRPFNQYTTDGMMQGYCNIS